MAIYYLNKEVVIVVEFYKFVGLLFQIILTIINMARHLYATHTPSADLVPDQTSAQPFPVYPHTGPDALVVTNPPRSAHRQHLATHTYGHTERKPSGVHAK